MGKRKMKKDGSQGKDNKKKLQTNKMRQFVINKHFKTEVQIKSLL